MLKRVMILTLLVSLVIGAVGVSGCVRSEVGTPSRETPARIFENVNPQETFALIQSNRDNPDFVIIDVRTPKELADGYIENVLNIDFYSETFRDELDKLDKDKTYLIYCRSGNRSGKALDIMAELNFTEAYNMLGGIIEWNAEGLPTVK